MAASVPGAFTHHLQVALWDLGCARPGAGQQLAPLVVAALPEGSAQASVAFNPADPGELMTTGPAAVLYWTAELAQVGAV